MKIVSLSLHNIKGYRGVHTFERFPDGVTLLLGRNGCGKTTVPQSIGLAVFGVIPDEFRGPGGSSLIGFVNHGASSGSIRVTVEFDSDRVRTFVCALSTTERDKGPALNQCRVWVVEGAVPPDQEIEPSESLLPSDRLSSLQDYLHTVLQTRTFPNILFRNLLAPPQTGGLTSFLHKAPRERAKQTESMLGLSQMASVSKTLSSFATTLRTEATVHAGNLERYFERSLEAFPELADLYQKHRRTKVSFEALEPAELGACCTRIRGRLLVGVVETLGMIRTRLAMEHEAKDARRQVKELLDAVQSLNSSLIRHEIESSRLTKLLARQEEMNGLTDRAKRYDDALTQARAVREEKAKIDSEISPVKERFREVSGQITELGKGLEARLQRIKEADKSIQNAESDNEALKKGRAELEPEIKTAREALKRSTELKANLDLLTQLHAAAAGVEALGDVRDSISQLETALKDGTLPDSSRGVLMVLEERLVGASSKKRASNQGKVDDAQATLFPSDDDVVDFSEQIQQWRTQAVHLCAEGESVVHELEGRLRRVEDQLARSSARDVERRQWLFSANQEQSHGLQEKKEKEQLVAELKARLNAMAEQARPTVERLHALMEICDAPEEKASWKHWNGLKKLMDDLEPQRLCVRTIEEQIWTERARLTELNPKHFPLSEMEDMGKIKDVISNLNQSFEDAERAVDLAKENVHRARVENQESARKLEFLERTESEVLEQLEQLDRVRAGSKMMFALNETVVSRLPRAVSRRVVERVSLLANDFFQQLFVHHGSPMELVWDPENYAVSVIRPEGQMPAKHASGGEKMAIGIALNLALIQYMAPQVRWLTLDEPTASLDEENRGGLREFMEYLRDHDGAGRSLFDQLFFISHESKLFEGLGSNMILDQREVNEPR